MKDAKSQLHEPLRAIVMITQVARQNRSSQSLWARLSSSRRSSEEYLRTMIRTEHVFCPTGRCYKLQAMLKIG